jgi:hypothetical protein
MGIVKTARPSEAKLEVSENFLKIMQTLRT